MMLSRIVAFACVNKPTFKMSKPMSSSSIVSGFAKELNKGLVVRRIVPQAKCRTIGSFVFLDHFGPTQSSAARMDVGPHPHIGLCTLTYLYEGSILHRDSTGSEQRIVPGEVNWMIAGKGITHSERTVETDSDVLHGLQLWIALPKDQEDIFPSFHHAASTVNIPIDKSESDCDIRLVVGTALGATQGNIPLAEGTGNLFLLDVRFQKEGGTLVRSICDFVGESATAIELGIYVSKGKASCFGKVAMTGEMIVARIPSDRNPRQTIMEIISLEQSTSISILGGSPLPEKRHLLWNFCSHNKRKNEWAAERWKAMDYSLFPPVINESIEDSIPFPAT